MTELEELRKLLAEATENHPLPWSVTESTGMDEAWCDWHEVGPLSLPGEKPGPAEALMLAAVNALPGLIARVEENERLREENAANRRLLRLYAIQHGTVTET